MVNTQMMDRIIKESGYKKKYVAEKIGITPQNLCDVLASRRHIKAEEVAAFCKMFNVCIEEIIQTPE